MNKLPGNSNLHQYAYSAYHGCPVQTQHGVLVKEYLDAIWSTLWQSIIKHPRTFAIRFDLHLRHSNDENVDAVFSDVISKFFSALNKEISTDLALRHCRGVRVHETDLRYIWTKERSTAPQPHYHVVIFVNNDTYNVLGSPSPNGVSENMATRIISAWASALNLEERDTKGLVHFPENPTYRINHHQPGFDEAFKAVFYRVSYFAKAATKEYGNRTRSFGCSRK
ncbi:inovirus Gp2 family protein [Motilimonas sp. 1_MG-2023]|uniref:inovirus Gp2 family protein n=1 Tax=Motilimonas sp. 1_MG-2023 TaxID=3062672 RepID=UPI0026E2BC67|nr:inovirus Gp2 family protein [Motilimonas sp. 1_MG-2023]MDO6528225.1 inovirus Gp2 family protein [Motilimonas sp. 1_MG-2023]